MAELWLAIIPAMVGCVMFGYAMGQRASRKDYDPLIESLLKLNERLFERLSQHKDVKTD